jgi:flavodoxin
MKIAVRYYTKTGNTKRLAEAVAAFAKSIVE